MPAGCAEAGVELVGDRHRPVNRDRIREQCVDATDPCGFGPAHVGLEMHHLKRRMHTAVGTSGRNDCDTLPGDFGQRAFESILHSAAVRLRLPAVKWRAVVFESERDTHVRSQRLTPAVRRAVRSPPPCDA